MKRFRRLYLRGSMLIAAALLCAYAMLWWWLLGPAVSGLQLPNQYSASYQVFVYGTLKQPLIRRFITGATVPATADQLPDFRRQGLTIHPEPGATVTGLRIEVNAAQMRRLDRYERLGLRYCRFEVLLASGQQAWVYQRLDGTYCELELQ